MSKQSTFNLSVPIKFDRYLSAAAEICWFCIQFIKCLEAANECLSPSVCLAKSIAQNCDIVERFVDVEDN
jgi:hypothetical protein